MAVLEPSAPDCRPGVTSARPKDGPRGEPQVSTSAMPPLRPRMAFSHVSMAVSVAGSTHTPVSLRSSVVSPVMFVSAPGMRPVRPACPLRLSVVSAVRRPRPAGMPPVRPPSLASTPRSSEVSAVRCPSAPGTAPVSPALLPRSRLVSLLRLTIGAMVPPRAVVKRSEREPARLLLSSASAVSRPLVSVTPVQLAASASAARLSVAEYALPDVMGFALMPSRMKL